MDSRTLFHLSLDSVNVPSNRFLGDYGDVIAKVFFYLPNMNPDSWKVGVLDFYVEEWYGYTGQNLRGENLRTFLNTVYSTSVDSRSPLNIPIDMMVPDNAPERLIVIVHHKHGHKESHILKVSTNSGPLHGFPLVQYLCVAQNSEGFLLIAPRYALKTCKNCGSKYSGEYPGEFNTNTCPRCAIQNRQYETESLIQYALGQSCTFDVPV